MPGVHQKVKHFQAYQLSYSTIWSIAPNGIWKYLNDTQHDRPTGGLSAKALLARSFKSNLDIFRFINIAHTFVHQNSAKDTRRSYWNSKWSVTAGTVGCGFLLQSTVNHRVYLYNAMVQPIYVTLQSLKMKILNGFLHVC